jgi:hypothetical protein
LKPCPRAKISAVAFGDSAIFFTIPHSRACLLFNVPSALYFQLLQNLYNSCIRVNLRQSLIGPAALGNQNYQQSFFRVEFSVVVEIPRSARDFKIQN